MNIIEKLKKDFEELYEQTRKSISKIFIQDLVNVIKAVIKQKEIQNEKAKH